MGAFTVPRYLFQVLLMFLSWDEISRFTDVDISVYWQYSWFLLCSKTNQTNDNNNSFFSLRRKVHIFKKCRGGGRNIFRGWEVRIIALWSGISVPERTRMQSGKTQVPKVGGHAAEDQRQIKTSSCWINHPQCTRSFTVVTD